MESSCYLVIEGKAIEEIFRPELGGVFLVRSEVVGRSWLVSIV